MDRKLNVFFSFLLVFVFILNAGETIDYWRILLGLLLALLFSLTAFAFRRLSLDGLFAATLVGAYIFGLGGWATTAVVLIFFISSSFFSGVGPRSDDAHTPEARRSGLQVWANGIWIVTCLVLALPFDHSVFLAGAIAAIAVATADTWATELRSIDSEKTYLITTFKPVEPGTDGGISLRGTLSGALGSLTIAGFSVYLFSFSLVDFFIILTAGFLGCLLDSYFGAIFQRNNRSVQIPAIHQKISITNNVVNAAATGCGAMLAIILKTLFL